MRHCQTLLGALLTATLLYIGLPGGPLAQESLDETADLPEVPFLEPDVWVLSTQGALTLYSLEGAVLGEAPIGARFKPVVEEDGWILVRAEDDTDLLFWIQREGVREVDLGSSPPASVPLSGGPEAIESPSPGEALFPTVAAPNPPTTVSTSTGTATAMPTLIPAVTPTIISTPAAAATTTGVPAATSAPATPSATTAPSPTPTSPPAADTTTPTATTTTAPSPTRTPTAMATLAPQNASVSMQDFSFGPSSVTIRVGGMVTWTNNGAAPHTATSTSGPGSFNTGMLSSGQSSAKTLAVAGTYGYQCDIHPSMTAMIIVR